MKAIYLLPIAGILSLSLPAQSQEFPFCYMQTATGQVISLDNLCRQPLEANGSLTPDQMFQQLILKEATNSDKEFLQGQGGMEEAIAKAKEFCSDYSKGLSKDQAFQAIAEESFIGGGSKRLNSYLNLISTIGNRVYCPAL